MGFDVTAITPAGFGHRYIGLRRLRQLVVTAAGERGDMIVTVSSVTGNLLLHERLSGGRPGEMVGVINIATESIEWCDDDDDAADPPSP